MAEYNLGTARGVIEIEYKGDGAKRARDDLKGTGAEAGMSSEHVKKAGRVSGIAGLAIAAGFGVAVKSAADFEQKMSGIKAVSGASKTEMEGLRNKALQLGKDTQFSASESADAIEELIKAGIPVADVMNGAADSVVALAAAGGVDMKTAATIGSNAMNQFGIKAKGMGKVVDSIAGAANASAIDVGDFGQSLQQVGAVANLAGVNFDDTATAIALMGNAGIKGSDAGTSLKTMFSRFIPTTKSATEEMDRLGLLTFDAGKAMKVLRDNGIKPVSKESGPLNKQLNELAASLEGVEPGSAKAAAAQSKLMIQTGATSNAFYDQKGNLKSLSEVSGILQKSLKGSTAEQKQATLQTLFGSDAIRAAAVLTKNGAKGFDKMATSMHKVSAADVAKTRMDNFKGSLEQLKGSLETAGIVIGTMLLPAIRKLVDVVTGVLNKFLNLDEGTQKLIAGIVGVIGVVLLSLAAFVKIVNAMKAVRLAFLAVRAVAIPTWLAALGPIALVIVAIAAVIAVIVLLWKHSQTFRKIVLAVWAAIKDAASAVANWFKGPFVNFFTGAWDKIKSGLTAVKDFFKSVWDGIKSVVSSVFGFIIGIVKSYINVYVTIFKTGIAIVKGIWNAFWGVFGGVIKAAFGLVAAIVKLGWVIVKGLFILYMRAVLAIVKTVWGAISGAIKAVWGVIKAIVKAGVTFVKNVVTAVWNGIKTVTSAVWNGIMNVIKGIWGKIGGTVMAAVDKVKSLISNAWDAVKAVTSRIWTGLKDIVSREIRGLVKIVETIKDKVLGPLKNAGTWLKDKGKEIIQGLLDGIEAMIHKVTEKINKITKIISDHLPGSPVKEGPLKVLNKGYAGKKIVQMVSDGISGSQGQFAQTVNNMMSIPAPALSGDLSRLHSSTTASYRPIAPTPRAGSSRPETSGGKVLNLTIPVHNPQPERASQSVDKVLKTKIEAQGWSVG